MTESELPTCPFCGGAANTILTQTNVQDVGQSWIGGEATATIACADCGARTKTCCIECGPRDATEKDVQAALLVARDAWSERLTERNYFKGRVFIIDGLVFGLTVFDGSLLPMQDSRRGLEEWATESLGEMGVEWFREELELDDGDHQVLFSGDCWSGWSHTADGDEYDEEFYLTKLESAPVPAEYAAYFLGSDDEVSNRDQ